MYLIKDYNNVYEYTLRDKEIIGLKFSKTPKNFIFKLVKKEKDVRLYVEQDKSKSAEYYKHLLAKYFSSPKLKDLLIKEFEGIDLELYGYVDKDVYIMDICINNKYIYQDHLNELAKIYEFNVLPEIFRGKYDVDKIEKITEQMIIKSRWEELTDTTGNYKDRYIILKEEEKVEVEKNNDESK